LHTMVKVLILLAAIRSSTIWLSLYHEGTMRTYFKMIALVPGTNAHMYVDHHIHYLAGTLPIISIVMVSNAQTVMFSCCPTQK